MNVVKYAVERKGIGEKQAYQLAVAHTPSATFHKTSAHETVTHKKSKAIEKSAVHKQVQLELSFYRELIETQLTQGSSLPYKLGLSDGMYQQLLTLLNDETLLNSDKNWHKKTPENRAKHKKSHVISELIHLRNNEKNDLIQLLLEHQSTQVGFAHAAATIIAIACLNPAHLWTSLGFNSRKTLGDWIALNFPLLHGKNNQNMRWKRFFYLQLCQQGGDYVCRAPSCEQCSSFSECFMPTNEK